MCNSCGCSVSHADEHVIRGDGKLTAEGHLAVNVFSNLLAANDRQAEHNREHLDQHGVLAINLMSSPGAGKTALLEATIQALKEEYALAVIEGDLETENDAERIRRHGIPAIQIVTGTACHLDAHLIHDALHHLDLAQTDILFIENVGNLVCPASFDLGHHRNVILLSVTEGDDKPAKYPVMFRAADVMLLTKMDLLPMMDDFYPQRAESNLRQLAKTIPVISLSAKIATGMEVWLNWLRQEVVAHKARVQRGQTICPTMVTESSRLHTVAVQQHHSQVHHHHH
jgi:hydrogenase nickel incorporation protein HypB